MTAGRPKKQVDEKRLEELAICQCSHESIASSLGISVDTLDRNFAEKLAVYRNIGKAKLHEAQWDKAIKDRDTQLLKHLGKIYLGQRDEVVVTTEEPGVRKLLKMWEGYGPKINTSSLIVKTASDSI